MLKNIEKYKMFFMVNEVTMLNNTFSLLFKANDNNSVREK